MIRSRPLSKRALALVGLALAGLALAGAGTSGCSALGVPSADDLSAAVVQVAVDVPSGADLPLVFRVRVVNASSSDLDLDRVRYRLMVDGAPLVDEELSTPVELAAESEVVIDLPVRLRLAALVQGLDSLVALGATPYELSGAVHVGGWLLGAEVPFVREGRLALADVLGR